MNLLNLIQRGFWEGYATKSLQIPDVVLCLCTVLLLAAYIFAVYRAVTKRSFYNVNFNLSLIALAVIIAGIILTIQSNIIISLGMVGALSIVRYRTAIKDPMDLVFLFWSISTGIICGAGFAFISVVIAAVISAALFLFTKVSAPRGAMILLVNSQDYRDEAAIVAVVGEFCPVFNVKSRNMTRSHLDMAIEVFPGNQGELIRRLVETGSVTSASLVSHDGEVTL